MFDTYGPFELDAHGKGKIDDLYRRIKVAAQELDSAFGVYIVAARDAGGPALPWYVGRTYRNFGTRLKQHFESGKFRELNKKTGLQLFLIARTTTNGIPIKSVDAMERDFTAVARLELLLVGTCMRINSELLNKQLRRFHHPFYVAGFIDRGQEHNRDDSAKALAELLQTS